MTPNKVLDITNNQMLISNISIFRTNIGSDNQMFISMILIIRPRLAFVGSKNFWAFLSIDNKDDPICSVHMYISFSQSSVNFEVQESFAGENICFRL